MKANNVRVRRIVEILVDTLIEAEERTASEVQHDVDMYWFGFLKSEGQAHIWRKGIIARHMLIE